MTSRRSFLNSAIMVPAFSRILGLSHDHPWERRFLTDPETGIRILQVTSFPTINMNMYFHSRCWTPDAKTFLFWSMTQPKRGGVMDLYRSNVEGTELAQLTDGKSLGNAALHPAGSLVYFTSGDSIYTLDIRSLREARVATIKGGRAAGGIGSFTDDGGRFCFTGESPGQGMAIGYLETRTNQVHLLPRSYSGRFTHLQIEPKEGHLFHYIGNADREGHSLYVVDENGQNERALPIRDENGHNAWLGPSGRIYAALTGTHRGILVAAPGDSKPALLAKGPPNFWHPGCDPSGEWIVSDTSAPDDGLQLICVKTGNYCRLCSSASDNGHSQWTHPHPSVSPDARYVLFNSTRTGIPHVYVAPIPNEMKKRLQVDFQDHR